MPPPDPFHSGLQVGVATTSCACRCTSDAQFMFKRNASGVGGVASSPASSGRRAGHSCRQCHALQSCHVGRAQQTSQLSQLTLLKAQLRLRNGCRGRGGGRQGYLGGQRLWSA